VVAKNNLNGFSGSSVASPAVIQVDVPGEPTAIAAITRDKEAVVSWTTPANNGGSAITGYTVTSNPESLTCTTVVGVSLDANSCLVTGLTNGTAYTFTVVATNAQGSSVSSQASSAVTPSEPTFTYELNGDGTIAITGCTGCSDSVVIPSEINGLTVTRIAGYAFRFPTSGNPAMTSVVIPDTVTTIDEWAFSFNSLTSLEIPSSVTSIAKSVFESNDLASVMFLGDAPASSSYTFYDNPSLTEINVAFGATGFSDTYLGLPVVRFKTVPDAPTGVSAAIGNGQAVVSWTTPANDGGDPITGYTVTSSPAGGTCSTVVGVSLDANSCLVIGLTNGTAYTFTVVARNLRGSSISSEDSSAVTPATVPDEPTGVSATPGNGQAVVSWTAPVDNGGAAITGYTVTSSPAGGTCTTVVGISLNANSCVVTGLTNGTAYTFTVAARNLQGTSTSSEESSAVTPATVPDAPTLVSAITRDKEAVVSWIEPVNDGGSEITGYTVTSNPESLTCTTFVGISLDDNSCVVTDLTNETAYTFTVIATNANGSSVSSQASSAVTPSEPTFTYVPNGDGTIAITGCFGCSDSVVIPSEIEGLTVTRISEDAFRFPDSGIPSVTSVVIPDTVTTIDEGAFAGNSLTSVEIPASVTSIAKLAFESNDLESVTFLGNAPTTNVDCFLGNPDLTEINVPFGATGFSNPYLGLPVVRFKTVSDEPTGVVGISGKEQVSVSWTAPANDGGEPITGYTVTSDPEGESCTTDGALSCTITGLAKGDIYTFSVVATNVIGDSYPSESSAEVTVKGRNQAISITQISDLAWSDEVVTVSVSSNDVDTELGTELDVTLVSTTLRICTVDGSDITTLRPGTCTLRATQLGSSVYEAATPVTTSFQVLKATQTPLEVRVNSVTQNGAIITPVTLDLDNSSNPLAANVFQILNVDSGGAASVNLQSVQPIASSTAPRFSVLASDAAICAVNAQGLVTISDLGNCRVKVQAPANDYYLASGQQLASDPVGVLTVWISAVAYDANGGGPKPPIDTGESTVDNSFKSPGDTVPALVAEADPKVASQINFGSGSAIDFNPNGKVTPIGRSKLVGSITYVMSFSDKSKSFSVMGCPSKQYKDKAKKICKAPKLVPSSTCTLTSVKKMTGKEFTTMQPFKFSSCQINAAGMAKLKAADVSRRPTVVMKFDFNPVWPVNGKVKALSKKTGKVHTAVRRKGTFVMKFS
jgi:hypothetical protein